VRQAQNWQALGNVRRKNPSGPQAGESLALSVFAYDPKPPYEADAGQLT
jgi:hypothetical protein